MWREVWRGDFPNPELYLLGVSDKPYKKANVLIFWNCMACVHFHRKLWSLGNTNIIPFPGFSFFSLLVFNTSLQCRTSKPVSVPRLGCLGPTELQLPHNQLSSRCLWSEISSRKEAMEEITLPVVMTVRSDKVLIMFHSSVCADQLEFFMGRCSQTRNLHLAEGWVPLGFGEISLDKSRPLMANVGESSP